MLSLIPSGLNPSGRHHSTSLTTPSSVNGDMEKVYPECGKKITSTGSDFTPPGSPDFLIHLFLFANKKSDDYYPRDHWRSSVCVFKEKCNTAYYAKFLNDPQL